jgi:excinuclease UvrABC nuclease subunit
LKLKDLIKTTMIRRGIKFKKFDKKKHDSELGGGIYRMRDHSGEVIYVGKSTDLHRRLHQHIGKDTNTSYFIDEVKKIEFTQEPDPVYQNLLEGVYMAYYRPKYNSEVKEAKERFGEDFDPRE